MASSSSSTAASSYSSLLRRSKLSSYTPSIPQLYTPHNAAQSSLKSYGFKRPLPRTSPRTIQVNSIDDDRRTGWKSAIRQSSFVDKVQQVGDGIVIDRLVDYEDSTGMNNSTSQANGFDEGTGRGQGDIGGEVSLQSRFIPRDWFGPEQVHKGHIKTIEEVQHENVKRKPPNFFKYDQNRFHDLLRTLSTKNEEHGGDESTSFTRFIKFDQAKSSGQINESMTRDEIDSILSTLPEIDLYAHAQLNRLHLESLIERYLSSITPLSLDQSTPQIHPFLGLRYSSPTRLEAHLTPTVPGRILGPVNDPLSSYTSSRNYGAPSGSEAVLTSVLGHLSRISLRETNALPPTTFYPDSNTGERSNEPGKASFRISATINPTLYSNKVLASRSHSEEIDLLNSSIQFDLSIPRSSASSKPPLGSPAYSGDLPPSPATTSSSYTPTKLSEMYSNSPPQIASYLNTSNRRRSSDEQRAFEVRSKKLKEERRATDSKVFGVKRTGSAGGASSRSKELEMRLARLLDGAAKSQSGLGKGEGKGTKD